MQKFLILAFCLLAASTTTGAKVNPFAVSGVNIFASKGIVDNVTICGGDGLFLELQVSDCESVCNLQPGTAYDVNITMVTRAATTSLSLLVQATFFGADVTVLDAVLPNSSGPAGPWIINFTLTPNDSLSGVAVSIRANITHTDTEILELCIQTDVNIN